MTLRCIALFFLVLSSQWKFIQLLESVEELLCQNLEAGSRIPHPELCNIYIMCTDNAAMQISCEGRVLYNPATEVCDASYNICLHGLIRDRDGNIISYVKQTEEISEIVSDKDTDTDYETDYEIDDEEETDEIEEMDRETQTNASAVTKASTVTPPKQTSTQSTTTPNPSLISGHQQPVPIACPKVDNDNLLLIGHATKCSVYFICYHSKPVPMECAFGLYWSEKNYKCVPKELSECQERSDSLYPKCPPNGMEFLPHDTNCQQFWFCRDGFRMLQQCDAFDDWDIYEKQCKRKGRAICYKDVLKTMFT